MFLLIRQVAFRLKELKKPIEEAIYSAGTIILITATGGAFGEMLQQTSIGNWLAGISSDYKLAALTFGLRYYSSDSHCARFRDSIHYYSSWNAYRL